MDTEDELKRLREEIARITKERDEARVMLADRDESLQMELNENLQLFNKLGLLTAEDFGNDTSTAALARKIDGLIRERDETKHENEINAQQICRLVKERDEARAKCAEMLKCIQAHHAHHLDGVKVFFSQDGKPIDMETDLTEAYVESRLCDQTLHAFSGDCGKGWKSPEEYAALEAKLTARIGVIDSFITACGFNVNDGFEINSKKIFGLVGAVAFWHRLAKDCAVGIGPHGEYMTADDKCAAIEAAEKLYDCGKGMIPASELDPTKELLRLIIAWDGAHKLSFPQCVQELARLEKLTESVKSNEIL